MGNTSTFLGSVAMQDSPVSFWPTRTEMGECYRQESLRGRAWRLVDIHGVVTYTFYSNGVLSVYSEAGVRQRSWRPGDEKAKSW